MEQDPAEKETVQWEKVEAKVRAEADKVEVEWAVPLRRARSAPASARNAGIVHRMSVECPVSTANARSVERPW